MRRILAAGLALGLSVGLIGLGAAPAGADPHNKKTLSITLECGDKEPIAAFFEYSSSGAFHLVTISGNFLWKTLSFLDPATGEIVTIERGGKGQGHHDLTTCTYVGPVSGNSYTVTGFFTR